MRIDEGLMTIQYLQIDKRRLAVVDVKEAADLLEYIEDLEDSLEALRRVQRKGKLHTLDSIKQDMLGNQIKAVRLAQQLTQADLAKKLRTSQAFISKLEHPAHRPSLPVLTRVAKALGTTIEQLV